LSDAADQVFRLSNGKIQLVDHFLEQGQPTATPV